MTLVTDQPRSPGVAGRGGVRVELTGVVHLYRQAGADVVGLRSVDLEVEPGEMVALLGPSGMGKTTVLRLMAGLMAASAGIVRVDGTDLGRLKAAERRRLRAFEISYIVQGTLPNVLPYATALENVWFAQHAAAGEGHRAPWLPEELLEHLGLGDVADAPVRALPRGMQQAVAVAAGVAPGARLLLADEPTAQLTSTGAERVIALLQQVNADFGTTVVIVTHDPAVAAHFQRTVTIRDGRVGVEAHRGEEYAVVDGSGSVQLPPDALAVLPPNSRVKVVVTPTLVELHPPEEAR
ncbi:MAG TPA: ATP-binding cassette domain-containing protein [Acidimicrobiales bacterium]|nr:ATP-binding cassette domain-containing protein [Acidimicrobiales bacterium]